MSRGSYYYYYRWENKQTAFDKHILALRFVVLLYAPGSLFTFRGVVGTNARSMFAPDVSEKNKKLDLLDAKRFVCSVYFVTYVAFELTFNYSLLHSIAYSVRRRRLCQYNTTNVRTVWLFSNANVTISYFALRKMLRIVPITIIAP